MSEDRMTIVQAIQSGLKQGEFTSINPSRLASPTSPNPVARAHYAMAKELMRLHVPSLSVNTAPEEFEDVADYLRRVTGLFDMWLREVGEEVASNALGNVDKTVFSEQFFGVIDGNALHEIDKAAQSARDAQDEDADTDYRYDELRVE